MNNQTQTRQTRVINTFKTILEEGGIILDFETTGFKNAQPVSIGLVHTDGTVLMDSLCKPLRDIEEGAAAIHGIRMEHLGLAPEWKDLHPQFIEAVTAVKHIVIYNAKYDTEVLRNIVKASGLTMPDLPPVHCAMLLYAEWMGMPGYYGDYQWHKLVVACKQQGATVERAHHAVGDCLLTLALMKRLVEAEK